MTQKITIFLTALLFLLVIPNIVFADGQPPPQKAKSGNFSKSSFSNNNSWSKNRKALAPPDPNAGGTGGDPIPISGGLTFLMIGSTLYFIKRVRDEKQ